MSTVPTGVYINETTPWWLVGGVGTPADILASTVTINAVPNGNITLTHNISSGTEYNAPIVFQRPPADINAPSESLVMTTSLGVPTKPVDGEYITATKAAGTAYDDLAVEGLQVYGSQTTAGNTGAAAYITGSNGNLILAAQDSVYVSSLFVSTLTATNVVSTTATTGTSLTLTSFLSSLSVTTGTLSTNAISTSQIVSKDIFASTLTVSTLNAPNFTPAQVSTIVVDTKLTLTSTLSLTGSPTNIDLGLGDVIQGLIGGAATQALGVGIGGAALVTGSVALVTGRTSGGVNSNIFQTVNGSTQLQFSTIGQAVSSVFLTVDSPNPFTTPGLEISTTQSVAAGTYCVRSVGDPLYITNNVSSIQMYGQWVPVIQPTATLPAVAVSSFFVSSVNGAAYPPPGTSGIPSTLAASTITVNGNLTQSGTGTFNWGGNTMSGTQVVLNRPTSVNATLTTSGTAFLNAGATVNSGLTVASGPTNLNTGLTVGGGVTQMTNSLTVFGQVAAQAGLVVNGGNAQFNGPTIATNTFSANGLATFNGGLRANNISSVNISTANIDVSTVNGAPYPPGGGGGIPSTLNASTITFNGGLTNIGSAPIITNALSSFTVSTGSLFVSSVNGAVYPPPGSGGIPSTLAASTITLNGNLTQSGTGLFTTSGGAFLNAGATVNNGLTVSGIANFNNQVNMFQNASINGFLSVNNGLTVFNGLNLVSGNFTMNQAGATANIPILNATATIRSPALSTINISTTNINLTTVNGAPYPPGGGGGSIPSTLNASTLTVNGGQNITNGGLTVSGGTTTMNNSLTVLGQTFAVGGLVVEPPGAIFNGAIGATTTIQVAGLATLNGGVITPALSTNTISTAGLSVSSINGLPFFTGIPSTLNASTINVNGGINITNGGIINNSFEPIRTGFLSSSFISTGLIRADTVQAPIFNTNTLSTNVVRAGAVSTVFLSSLTITASNAGLFQLSSLTASINFITTSTIQALSSITAPSMLTNNLLASNLLTSPSISTTNIQATTVSSPTIFTTNLQADNTIVSFNSIASLSSITSPNMNTSSIVLSSINGTAYPPPIPGITPTGAITIWAGGFDNGTSTQDFAVPAGWLACNGQEVSQLTYPALYAVVGTKYFRGIPPTFNYFYLPDLTFAVPMGTPARNYPRTLDIAQPVVIVQFQTWISSYATNVPIEVCWKISSTTVGTINLGTLFPLGSIDIPFFPAVYVSKILQYDGYQGYILVKVADGVTPIPFVGLPMSAQAQGTIDQIGGDFIYSLGTYGVLARPTVTHNQTNLEVAVHQHNAGPDGFGPFPAGTTVVTALAANIRPTRNPLGVPFGQSTISTIGTGPPGFEDVSNIGTYTAPNFVNMVYIIKA